MPHSTKAPEKNQGRVMELVRLDVFFKEETEGLGDRKG